MFTQRFVIRGSKGSDGSYAGTPGAGIDADGDTWTLTMDWLDGTQFRPSRIRRTATYDVQKGLIITLGADDGPLETADHDFNDIIVTAESQDPALDPLRPSGNPPDFTIPEGIITHENHAPYDVPSP